jgi:hypothetical protein
VLVSWAGRFWSVGRPFISHRRRCRHAVAITEDGVGLARPRRAVGNHRARLAAQQSAHERAAGHGVHLPQTVVLLMRRGYRRC